MKKIGIVLACLALAAGRPADSVAREGGQPPITVEMFSVNKKVIPLAFEHGEYRSIHVKPPEILIRNVSGSDVTIGRASLIGKSEGRETVRYTVHEAGVAGLMAAENGALNRLLADPDDQAKVSRLRRIHGEPVVAKAGFIEGNVLPPRSCASLALAKAFFFFYEGTARVDQIEIVLETKDAGGTVSSVSCAVPYTPYACRGRYLFPVAGASVVGSLPIGHSHRFANGQEFAVDILDIRRSGDGGFSTSRVPSPMVIMGSDNAADYHIFGRPVRAIGDGIVIETADRFPDSLCGNPRQPFQERIEKLRPQLLAAGASPSNITGGNYVFIDHGNGEYSRYCHLRDRIPVKAGTKVRQGDVIGYVGNSGQSTEPHLHFELLDSPEIDTANGLPVSFSNLDLAHALESPSFGEKNSIIFSEFVFVFSD